MSSYQFGDTKLVVERIREAQDAWYDFVGKDRPFKEFNKEYYGFQREAMLNFIVSRLEMMLNELIEFANFMKPLDPANPVFEKPTAAVVNKLKSLLCGSMECGGRLEILNCQTDNVCPQKIKSTLYVSFVFMLLLYGSLKIQQNTKLVNKAITALENFITRWGGPSESLVLHQVPFVLYLYPTVPTEHTG